MVDKLRTREELYLAKIAGREVDLTELNPPAGNNVVEVLLGEIATRLGNAAAAPAAAQNKTNLPKALFFDMSDPPVVSSKPLY